MGGGVMELSMPLAPVVVVYGVACIVLNWAINVINHVWRQGHMVTPEQVPAEVARWMQQNSGIQVFRGAAGHPFTPGTVVLGVLVTWLATYCLVYDTTLAAWQVLVVNLSLLAVGGVIMSLGDVARYIRYG